MASVIQRLIAKYSCKLDSGQGNCSQHCTVALHLYPSLTTCAGAEWRLLRTGVQSPTRFTALEFCLLLPGWPLAQARGRVTWQ